MESGSGSQPFRPGWGPGSAGYGPDGEEKDGQEAAQSSSSAGPQSPAPGGPQSPSPGAAPPVAEPSPSFPGAPPPGSGAPQAPRYGGPVPPGGWQQPLGRPAAPVTPGQGQLAGWGSRLGAFLIDGLIVGVPSFILLFVLMAGAIGITGADNDEVSAGAAILAGVVWLLLTAAVGLLYAPLLMRRQDSRNGQTWGKQMLGIRAVRDSGEPWTFGSAALREIVLKQVAVGIASFIIPFIPWFLNFFWPLWDDQNRALHDMAASSHVVRA